MVYNKRSTYRGGQATRIANRHHLQLILPSLLPLDLLDQPLSSQLAHRDTPLQILLLNRLTSNNDLLRQLFRSLMIGSSGGVRASDIPNPIHSFLQVDRGGS